MINGNSFGKQGESVFNKIILSQIMKSAVRILEGTETLYSTNFGAQGFLYSCLMPSY